MELYHHCSRKIKGSNNIARCLEDCKLCKNEPDRKDIMLFVGKKMEMVMSFCRNCNEKLADRPICEKLFLYFMLFISR